MELARRNELVTNKESDCLSSYKKIVTSQCGEDGVIEKIFEIIEEGDKWCVEFGAGDGKASSNIWDLVTNKGWSGIAIEADNKLYNKLLKTYKDNERVTCINKLVNFEGPDIFDNILSNTLVPKSFDLLCIDVDGNDYHVWGSIESYKPKVVLIEFNPTIPVDIEWVQPRNIRINQGSSLLSLTNLGKKRGYELIAALDWNAFFVRKEYFKLFKIEDNSPYLIHKEHKYETRLFQLYDGTLVLAGNTHLLWHNIEIDQKKMQVLPKFLRKYPDKLNPFMIIIAHHGWKCIFIFILEKIQKLLRHFFNKVYQK